MKVSYKAFTDYSLYPDEEYTGTVREVVVISYDNNKYCRVTPVEFYNIVNTDLQDTATSAVKIGYVFMDAKLSVRPNRKTSHTWGGIKRPPKKRVRRTYFNVKVLEQKLGDDFDSLYPIKDTRHLKFPQKRAAVNYAEKLFLNPNILEVCVTQTVSTGRSTTFGFEKTLFTREIDGISHWDTKLERYFGPGKCNPSRAANKLLLR